MGETGFEYLAHLVTVPVTVDGVETTFVLDSGIGPTIVREGLLPLSLDGSFNGKRMSGQSVTIALARLGSIAYAGTTWTESLWVCSTRARSRRS
jgi:hypothetical protein